MVRFPVLISGVVQLSKKDVMTIIRIMFPTKSPDDLERLNQALHNDQPYLYFEYMKLFLENRDMDQGKGTATVAR
mgnify:CR=1 FL=1